VPGGGVQEAANEPTIDGSRLSCSSYWLSSYAAKPQGRAPYSHESGADVGNGGDGGRAHPRGSSPRAIVSSFTAAAMGIGRRSPG